MLRDAVGVGLAQRSRSLLDSSEEVLSDVRSQISQGSPALSRLMYRFGLA